VMAHSSSSSSSSSDDEGSTQHLQDQHQPHLDRSSVCASALAYFELWLVGGQVQRLQQGDACTPQALDKIVGMVQVRDFVCVTLWVRLCAYVCMCVHVCVYVCGSELLM